MTRRQLPHPRELRANGTLCSRCGDTVKDSYQGKPAPGHPRPCDACRASPHRSGGEPPETVS
ncbi:hypothetical protein [Inquilinus sp. CA228]|uniref:hypothetical protein n=1 Tax=Inquilinus sp. CA228 TaxID=3455609 RepID=UPI003F8D8EFE